MKIREYFRTAACFYPNWDQRMADDLVVKFGLDPKKRVKNLSKGMGCTGWNSGNNASFIRSKS